MGQYHYPVNLTRKEFIVPHELGCGLKLWEQGAQRYGVGAALVVLLAASNGHGGGDFEEGFVDDSGVNTVGRWAGNRIALVGDYAGKGDLPTKDAANTIFAACDSALEGEESNWTNITPLVVKVLEAEYEIRFTGDGWKQVVRESGEVV